MKIRKRRTADEKAKENVESDDVRESAMKASTSTAHELLLASRQLPPARIEPQCESYSDSVPLMQRTEWFDKASFFSFQLLLF